jgi:uncharacterized damage-inducible protein DinB
MNVADVRTRFAFNRWANHRLLETAARVSAADFTRDLHASFGSLRGTLVHILWGEKRWLRRWLDDSVIPDAVPEDFPDVASIEAAWTSLEREQQAFVAGLTDDALAAPRTVREHVYPLGDLVQHLLNHSTYHRGQVALLMRLLGQTPTATDYRLFLTEVPPVTTSTFIAGAALAAIAALPAAAPAQGSSPCASPEHRQFDFWLGDWDVVDSAGAPQGRNTVTREQNGCAIQEHWTGADGSTGTSLNTYLSAEKRWHQTWIDGQGGVLLLDGTFKDGAMVLEGRSAGPRGGVVINRIAWTPLDASRVRQIWTASRDEGKTWTTVFDGIYKRRGG